MTGFAELCTSRCRTPTCRRATGEAVHLGSRGGAGRRPRAPLRTTPAGAARPPSGDGCTSPRWRRGCSPSGAGTARPSLCVAAESGVSVELVTKTFGGEARCLHGGLPVRRVRAPRRVAGSLRRPGARRRARHRGAARPVRRVRLQHRRYDGASRAGTGARRRAGPGHARLVRGAHRRPCGDVRRPGAAARARGAGAGRRGGGLPDGSRGDLPDLRAATRLERWRGTPRGCDGRCAQAVDGPPAGSSDGRVPADPKLGTM